jgi:hypothetical protein
MTFDCPFCEYESDTRGGVEAHISGKSDSSHEGKVGRMYRSEIEQESQPGGLVGRLRQQIGENPKLQSVLEEVRRYEESHREELEELREENEELRGRLDRVERSASHIRDLRKRQLIQPALVDDMMKISALVAELADGKKLTCPECGVEVKHSHTRHPFQNGVEEGVECSNCDYVIGKQTEAYLNLTQAPRGEAVRGDQEFWKQAESDDWLE